MGLPLFAPRRLGSTDQGSGEPLDSANFRLGRVVAPDQKTFARGREIAALLLWSGAVFVALALASYRVELSLPEPAAAGQAVADGVLGLRSIGPNWMGPIGETVAGALARLTGVTSWVFPVELMLLGVPFVRSRKSLLTPQRLAGNFLVLLLGASLVQVACPDATAFGALRSSGVAGELFGEIMRSLFSTAGSFLVGFALLGLVLIGRASFSFIALMRWLARFGTRGARRTAAGANKLADAWREARDIDRLEREEKRVAALPRIAEVDVDEALVIPDQTDVQTEVAFVEPVVTPSALPPVVAIEETPAKSKRVRKPKPVVVSEESQVLEFGTTPTDFGDVAERPAPRSRAKDKELTPPSPAIIPDEPIAAPKPAKKIAAEPAGPQIVDTSAALQPKLLPEKAKPKAKGRAEFELPSMDFLTVAKHEAHLVPDKAMLFANAELLIKTLADYGVVGKVEEILPGPTVTTYEVSPAAGTKVSKVASLADDLALALARKVRIVAPIPGKNRIGFELPNEQRSPVNFRDLVEDARFQALDVPLPVVLGRDIVGNPVYADLASMPHVIVAGATGAGKSVGLNVMLTSLLYRRSPDDLRMLMIDPKVVELAPFDKIPHMLLPVVTDMKQAANALKWAVDEMERRYQLFADAGTKNISTYNGWVQRVIRGEAKNPLGKKVKVIDHNGFVELVDPAKTIGLAEAHDLTRDGIPDGAGEQQYPEKMPFIVIVVDEFADLMMQQGKEVEVAVARLAQKARAAGMHVILATQRPSVDVITGMIKANFPTRVAFRVAQKVDSRTILDEQGAEHLLGRGDMLIRLNGTNETRRVQCPWVSEEEVQLVTDHLRAQGEPVYDENILKPRDEEGAAEVEDAEQDTLYDDAVRIVAETRRCSTSWLQRKLGLGYNRAARIVEMMERRGLVGPANGSKDREVLVEAL